MIRKSILVLVALGAFQAGAVPMVVETVVRPACYERPNSAVPAALAQAERKAQARCGAVPFLLGVQVQIRHRGGCTPTTVVARYRCG